MAYTSQAVSPRGGGYSNKPSPRKQILEDGPIKELVYVIEETRPEQWQKRTTALADLVAQIPTGNEYSRGEAWFNSPPTLRHLHQPVGELLKDPRSTVVKRTCESLIQLFSKCQGDAKYLFKDLMPTVLNVHAQTVQVIRSQVQAMVLEAIPVVPCKMVMPLWLDRLKTDKSRTVREACVLYLGMGLKHWTSDENGELGSSYLTDENWIQIGTALIKTLRDPSPTVRAYTKTGIALIRDNQPELWDDLIRDPDGPAGKDIKLQKWLIKVSENGEELNAGNEELSVASRYSHYSHASKNRGAPSTPNSKHGGGFNASRTASRGRATAVPVQISVGNKQDKLLQQQAPRQMRGLGPPLRRPFAQAMDPNAASSPTHPYSGFSNQNNISNGGGGGGSAYAVPQLGTPPRPPSAASPHRGRAIVSPQQRSPSPSPRRTEPRHKVPLRSRSASSASPSEKRNGGHTDDNTAEDSRSVFSARNRSRPAPEALNGNVTTEQLPSSSKPFHHHQLQQQQQEVIDLVDQASPQHIQDHQQQQQYATGAYRNASSTEMLDVTKSIDQTLAHLEMPNVSREHQLHQQHHNQTSDQVTEEGPFIASMNELKHHASKRRSRRSMKLQERWSRGDSIGSPAVIMASSSPMPTIPSMPADAVSSLGGGSVVNDDMASHSKAAVLPPVATTTNPATMPEHYVIAEQLLRVHKSHVDQIMETLKIEMDTLRDFEQSLEQEQAPTPDQVLDYFESVGLCLDQRTTAGNILQREMDRISRGGFQHNNNNNGSTADA